MVIEQPGPLAVGSEAVIFTATSEGILGQVNAWAYDLTTRARSRGRGAGLVPAGHPPPAGHRDHQPATPLDDDHHRA